MATASLTDAHQQFEAALPAIVNSARHAFRHWRPQDREEAVADCRAAAWSAWHGLIRRGKDPIAVGITGIAYNAVRYVKKGRRVGRRHCGRGAMDVWNYRAQLARQFRLVSLDEARDSSFHSVESWRDCLATDHRFGPADAAVFQLDFATWLNSLSTTARRVAELLAAGYRTVETAEVCRLSPGRVSQLRAELMRSWRAFQNGTAC